MIAILGAGAFGSALACLFGKDTPVALWGRNLNPDASEAPRLKGHPFPANVTIASTPADAAYKAGVILLATPMRALTETLAALPDQTAPLIACCKGIDPNSGLGPVSLIKRARPDAAAGILTGPSFARDIAAGLPTALTLAMDESEELAKVQNLLSRPTLRLYRSDDVIGAELGGALKNVLAIAAGAVIGARLGQSAQASLITRGFAEIRAIAEAEGAQGATMLGLSGMGDLMLTAFSDGSRNYRYGLKLGAGERWEEDTTVEGMATAEAVVRLAARHGLETPVLGTTHGLITGELNVTNAVQALMSRPLRKEN